MLHSVKYRVVGVDAVTGGKRQIEVEADCEKDALLWAREIGILTFEITPVHAPMEHPQAPAESAAIPANAAPAPLPTLTEYAVGSPRRNESNPAAAVFVVGLVAVIFLVCSGVLSRSSSSSSSNHNHTPADSGPSFSSDKERLEWRSQNHLPMTDEDVKYEQQKVLDAYQKMKDSEVPVGR